MGLLRRLFRGPAVPSITPRELEAKLKDGETPTIIDVRERDEWDAAHIPGSIPIPLGELPRRMDELPKDEPILCVCRSGNRSAMATNLLVAEGYEAANVDRGLLGWSGPLQREPS